MRLHTSFVSAKSPGVPIIACSPSCDLVNTPPFKSDPTRVESDALAAYITGRTEWEAGNEIEAKRWLTLARQRDLCPLRATTPIIQSVGQRCRDFGVPLIDTDVLLDTRDHTGAKRSDGIADPEFFADHVHPTIAGHQRIAEAISQHFIGLGWITSDQKSEARYQRAAAEHLSSLDETYYARGRQRLAGLKRWAAGRAAMPITADDAPGK